MRGYAAERIILNLGVFHGGYNTAAVPVRGPDGRPAFGLSCAGSAMTHSADFLRSEVAPALLGIARSLEEGQDTGRGQTS